MSIEARLPDGWTRTMHSSGVYNDRLDVIEGEIGAVKALAVRTRHKVRTGAITEFRVAYWREARGNRTLLIEGQYDRTFLQACRCAQEAACRVLEVKRLPPVKVWNTFGDVHRGNSAAAAISAAIVSLVTATPIRSDTAITGNLDNFGRVHDVGDISFKIRARSSQLQRLLLPACNDPQVRQALQRLSLDQRYSEYVMVHNLQQVLDHLLAGN